MFTWIFLAYVYLLLLITILLLLDAHRRSTSIYRGQALVLASGALLPLITSVAYSLGLSPIPRVDISPAVFSVCGIVVSWGLYRYRLFDLVPVARATVIEGMNDSVIVLVAQGQTYKKVSETLCLSERTVKYHMREILNRLHRQNRAEVIAYATRAGLIPAPAAGAAP